MSLCVFIKPEAVVEVDVAAFKHLVLLLGERQKAMFICDIHFTFGRIRAVTTILRACNEPLVPVLASTDIPMVRSQGLELTVAPKVSTDDPRGERYFVDQGLSRDFRHETRTDSKGPPIVVGRRNEEAASALRFGTVE